MYPQQIQDKLIDIGSMVLKTGALDNKTRVLIALSTSFATYCAHCYGQAKSLAKKFGVTEKEIEEAENIALRMREKCKNQFGLFSLNEQLGTPKSSEFERGDW